METPQLCPFCNPESIVLGDTLAFALYVTAPVTHGHLLINPRRHVTDWFDTSVEEHLAVFALAPEARSLLMREFAPDGLNLGFNIGGAAGQTVSHAHMHVIRAIWEMSRIRAAACVQSFQESNTTSGGVYGRLIPEILRARRPSASRSSRVGVAA
jgi:diadenosine tetraphosphate (Ap4A) HIT family hydrolase